jgi:hypothetical protein
VKAIIWEDGTMRTMTGVLLGAALIGLVACGQGNGGTEVEAPAAETGATDAGASTEVTAASLTPEQADQAFRCNALFTAVVAGRIGGQMEPLPADLDGSVRTSGAAYWQERETAAVAALGLTPDEATARVTQASESVVGRRALSDQDLTDLRACVAAMG